MKRRVTFLYNLDSPFDPKQLEVDKTLLQIKSLKAAREERWTTSLYDWPQEVQRSPAPWRAITDFWNSYGWL